MKFLRDIPKEKLQKIILVCIIGASISAGVFIFYVNKQLAAIQQTESKSESLRQQIVQAEKQNKSDQQLELERDSIMRFADAQRVTLVSGDPLSWTVRAIGDLAAKHPVQVLSWRQVGKGSNRTISRYEVFTMHLEIEGDYDGLGRFIEAMENKFPVGEIQRLDVGAPNPGSPLRRISFEISLPILPDSQQPKATAEPAKHA
jgi:Tfp pilus assembly protein PilO